ncbi:MAG: AAC(3) family N-acetyltransferase [Nitrospirae bacterium]|nr:AAC(3) family N-acetyltransferase [Nitrospirota bacterium]
MISKGTSHEKHQRIESLTVEWKVAGVSEGDMLLLQSNIIRTLLRTGNMLNPADVLQSFLNALGSKGTLLLPLFNFDFAKGIPFDIRNTVSRMGSLTEAGRKYPGAVRTGHPMASFAAIGYDAGLFENLNNYSAYGSESPLAILKENNGKLSVLDLEDQDGMTFYHHVEEVAEVDYRYYKSFTGQYITYDGTTEVREYGFYVRNLDLQVENQFNPMGELLWAEGLYKGFKPFQGCGLRTVYSKDVFDKTMEVIKNGEATKYLMSYGKLNGNAQGKQ